jgi:oligopeptide/dipeptide ABC transporter ATP-binding protein
MIALDHAPARKTAAPAPLFPAPAEEAPIFSVSGLAVTVDPRNRPLELISDVSLEVRRGECLGVVGESGCGKTVSFLAALGLMPRGTRVEGEVSLGGKSLLGLPEKELEAIRGRRIGMIFQDPQSALNPVLTIGRQLTEPLRVHTGLSGARARTRAVELLTLVGIPGAEARLSAYPHQISGGMCQRVMIAMALASEPEVLIADEPTTALDATVQLQVLDLLKSIQRKTNLAIILITHDLGVVARACDRVAVMYAGRTVETRSVPEVFRTPWHPYTAALIQCLPRKDGAARPPSTIAGEVPMPGKTPAGCAFHPRCGVAAVRCGQTRPAVRRLSAQAGSCACHTPIESRPRLAI